MFALIANQIKHFQSYRHDIATLRSMDDRQLSDIGLSRGNIKNAVRYGRL